MTEHTHLEHSKRGFRAKVQGDGREKQNGKVDVFDVASMDMIRKIVLGDQYQLLQHNLRQSQICRATNLHHWDNSAIQYVLIVEWRGIIISIAYGSLCRRYQQYHYGVEPHFRRLICSL
ncbi:hypothetical protein Syun_026077 [Stephania yunnanensis]|uniref:Uncharacterized protein n=1 Tax=Stephania yunnanensis TaxID=152371 RepID=A0AAP0EY84_9MAGN